MMAESSKQFERLDIEIGKKAASYKAFMAIWSNRGRGHVVIAAPTIDDLLKGSLRPQHYCMPMKESQTNLRRHSAIATPFWMVAGTCAWRLVRRTATNVRSIGISAKLRRNATRMRSNHSPRKTR